MITRIQLRRDTDSNWAVNNPILAVGEIGINTTTFNFKIGNGIDSWNNLNYFSVAVDDVISQAQLDAAIAAISLDLSEVSQSIIPDADSVYDLGSENNKWKDLYLSGDTIFLGNILLKENTDGSFGVFKADEAEPTPLEIVLKEGQVTDTELSEDSTDIKSRFTTHKDAVEGRLDTIEGNDQTTGSIAKALADAKDYADNEIDAAKLSLGTNFSVADTDARDALEDLTVGDVVFVADNGDGKFAQYKVTVASPNAEFIKIMDEDILLNALSAENIKSAYEGNADTNAFTDNEKTNLTNLSNVTKEIATESEAETGESNNKYMTPLRTANAIAFQTNVIDGGEFN